MCFQALSNNEEVTLDRLNTMFSPATGLLGLGLNAVCNCEGHSQLWEDPQTGGFIRLREVRSGFTVLWSCIQRAVCVLFVGCKIRECPEQHKTRTDNTVALRRLQHTIAVLCK